MEYSPFQDLWNAFLGAIAATAVAAVMGLLGALFPRVRRWFVEERLGVPLISAFLMSVVVAGAMGLFLRHHSWEQLHSMSAGLSIIAGGRIDATTNGDCSKRSESFIAEKRQTGQYEVCFETPLKDIIILTSPAPNQDENPLKIS
jgi:hypothetical protein